jgi:hypothetical protein
MSRPNAVEIRNVLLGFEEARHPLVSRTMLLGYESGAFDLTIIADLGGIRVALEQKGFRARAGEAEHSDERCSKEQPCPAGKGAQSDAASIKDSIN